MAVDVRLEGDRVPIEEAGLSEVEEYINEEYLKTDRVTIGEAGLSEAGFVRNLDFFEV